MTIKLFFASHFFKIQYQFGMLKSSEVEWSILDKITLKGSTILDIGSNIGRYSLKFASITGDKGSVIAIEPNNQINEMANNIKNFSKLRNITQINACVSDKTCIKNFYEDWSAPSGVIFSTATRSSLFNTFSEKSACKKKKIKTLKKLCITIDSLKVKPSLIKIDAEGAEIEILKGGLLTFNKYKPLLIVEDNDLDFTFLKKLGYKIYRFNKSRNIILSHFTDKRSSIINHLVTKNVNRKI